MALAVCFTSPAPVIAPGEASVTLIWDPFDASALTSVELDPEPDEHRDLMELLRDGYARLGQYIEDYAAAYLQETCTHGRGQ